MRQLDARYERERVPVMSGSGWSHAALGASLLILLVSCRDELVGKVVVEPANQVVERTAVQTAMINTGMVVAPQIARLRGVANVAESWEIAVRHAAPEDRAYLEFVQEKYPGIVEFHDQKGRSLLEELAIPLPEEWLAAKRLSDAELKTMMEHGNPRATAFYADRMTDRFQGILDEAGSQDVSRILRMAPQLLGELSDLRAKASNASLMALQGNPSAFTVYVYGREGAITGNATFMLPASYEAAYDLGDPRARDFIHYFSEVNGGTSPAGTLSSYKRIRRLAGM